MWRQPLRFFRLAVPALLLLSAFSPSRPAAPGHGTLTVLYGANREGEIEPCGCQVHQLGGLHRLLAFFSRQGVLDKRDGRLFVESGDSFFSLAELDGGRLEREKLKAMVMANAFKRLGLDAFCPGERDFTAGMAFLQDLQKASGATFVAANVPGFRSHVVVVRGGIAIGVIGIVDPKIVASVPGVKVADPEPALREAIDEAKEDGAQLILLLSHLGLEGDRRIAARVPGIDLIVGSHSFDVLAQPVKAGNTLIFQPQNQGQQIGEMKLKMPGREVASHRLVELTSDYEEENEIARLIKEYKEAVRVMAVKEASAPAPAVSSDRPFVANTAYCKNCHAKQYDFWAQTKHASAMLVLYAKNSHFDPTCIVCHTLGFQQAGGFSAIARPLVFEAGKAPKEEAKTPFVEAMLKEVFAVDPGKGSLDSRKDPERYKVLAAKYREKVHQVQEAGLERNYMGVQCEHCHGNRHGHPGEGVTLKKVSEASCKSCHTPPHAAPYKAEMFPKVACPLSSKI